MKTRLDPLYDLFGAIGGLFIVLTLAIQVVSIFGRFVSFTIEGYDAYAGYFLAAGSFFALAHTLRRGDHIRVTLMLSRLTGSVRIWMEVFCLAVATLLTTYFAYYSCKLAWGSWAYNDVSHNIDATPLWIPQLSMALGMIALALAFAEEFYHVARRRELPVQSDELARTE
ncbi:MAG: TRAP transporter small permease [Burkholderiales bacterium]|jgi:TRAP-type C4-dicarboxylate transport system permease small subunit|nr:TRAP transporter small permease [Burkholderiales bacterium]MCA3229368.1 TRAP transporter small permease [Burkholderiales bacterium]